MRAHDISHGYRKYTLHFLNRITYATRRFHYNLCVPVYLLLFAVRLRLLLFFSPTVRLLRLLLFPSLFPSLSSLPPFSLLLHFLTPLLLHIPKNGRQVQLPHPVSTRLRRFPLDISRNEQMKRRIHEACNTDRSLSNVEQKKKAGRKLGTHKAHPSQHYLHPN